jgi:SAM-dependent methyltransferase
MLNDWNEVEAERAKNTWGHKRPDYTQFMFDSAVRLGNNFLDLGCGFGRFFRYLIGEGVEGFTYTGYDSSESMLARFPEHLAQAVSLELREITQPFPDLSDTVVVCSAVMIHNSIETQDIVLSNLLLARPKAILFDINVPAGLPEGKDHFERHIKISNNPNSDATFRMTWQSKDEMISKLTSMFPDYKLDYRDFDLKQGRVKTMFILERR